MLPQSRQWPKCALVKSDPALVFSEVAVTRFSGDGVGKLPLEALGFKHCGWPTAEISPPPCSCYGIRTKGCYNVSLKFTSEGTVTPDEREQMHILCQRIAVEQDPQKFSEFVNQLNKLLDRKRARLAAASQPKS